MEISIVSCKLLVVRCRFMIMEYPIIINKYIRDKGLASRREADELIAAGQVLVNGQPAKTGMMITERDRVELRQSQAKQYVYLAYCKPRGLATQSLAGEESVITQWQAKKIFPIGRLDKDSEGLLILTNDRRLTAKILGADVNVEKEYVVHVREPLRNNLVAIMQKGMQTETFGRLLPVEAEILDKHSLRIVLHEGKKHQLRVMLGELGYTVTGLKRLRVGPVNLGKLKPGENRPLTQKELDVITR